MTNLLTIIVLGVFVFCLTYDPKTGSLNTFIKGETQQIDKKDVGPPWPSQPLHSRESTRDMIQKKLS